MEVSIEPHTLTRSRMDRARLPHTAAWLVLTLAVILCRGRPAVAEPIPEPAAPPPSAGVAQILEQADGFTRSHRPEEALRVADRALNAAQAAQDAAGTAGAHAARARALEVLDRREEATTAWQQAAAAWQRLGDGPAQIDALAAAGLLALARRQDPASFFAQALAVGQGEEKRPLAAARALQDAGRACYDRGQLRPARRFWEAALPILEKKDADSLQTALCLNDLGVLLWRGGETDRAESLHRRALAIREKLAPDSLAVAMSLNNLGLVAHTRRSLETSRQYHQRALALQEKLAPGSLDVAISLNNLGGVALDQGDLTAAETFFRRALTIQEERAPESLELTALLGNLADLAERKRDLAAATEYSRRALVIWEKTAPGSPELAQALNNLANLSHTRGELAAATEYHRRALAIVEQVDPNSPDVAALLLNLGSVASDQGDLAAAAGYYQRAREFYERQSPRSLEYAACLDRLGNVALYQSDLPAAQSYHQRALALRHELAPDSLEVADSLMSLATIAQYRGDLASAMRDNQRALALREKLAPASPLVASSLDHIAGIARLRGDLTAASETYQRALALFEEKAPNSLDLAICLNNVGGLARQQHDPEAAREFYRRALAIRQQLAPDSLQMATLLDNLGGAEHDRGDLAAALAYHQRALALFERQAPDSLDLAKSLNNVGDAAKSLGDLKLATTMLRRAVALQERLVPNSLDVAVTLDNLGAVARLSGDFPTANRCHGQALSLFGKLAPRSPELAVCLVNLGQLARSQGDWTTAERYWQDAWQMMRTQAVTLGGDTARQGFGASNASFAAELVGAQVALGKTVPAFATLEESRAQALQQLMVERRLVDAGAPPKLQAALRAAIAARDHAEAALSEASAAAGAARRNLAAAQEEGTPEEKRARLSAAAENARKQLEAAQSAYVQARLQADQQWAAIKRRAPRAYVPPLSAEQALRVLPPGSLFMAFSVGAERTHLFLLGAPGGRPAAPTVYRLPVTPAELQQLVRRLRTAVTDPEADAAETTSAARSLFARLFPPRARARLLRAKHLLVSPDGPLWEAPFAALVTNAQGAPRYLGEQTAITYTQSLTLFAQSRRDRPRLPRGGKAYAVVVGDPVFDRAPTRLASASRPPSLPRGERSALFRDGSPPAPLPGTKVEAAEIARLYGGAPLLEARATEAALRQQIRRADVVHLATHGYLDPMLPMSSGVLLTVPEREPAAGQTRDDGVLQAWEIYSQLELKAELVVLSACETGRGENVAGEGIVGLTRALQYAGARSIVASQWKVSDESTRTLMVSLHRKLRQGLAKDEALRQAMAAVRANPRTAQPYFWAPFILTGDPANPGLGAGHAASQLPLGQVQRRKLVPKARR